MINEEIFKNEYGKLNVKQREVVDTIEGPVMVVAGPGTGKTQVLGLRVANIIRKTEVSPHNILCLTFTENGALNMRERLQRFIGKDAYRVGIFTFHGFCNSIIARYPEYFYEAVSFTMSGDIARAEIFESIFAQLPHGHPFHGYHPENGYTYMRGTIDRIKQIKDAGYTADEYTALIEALIAEQAAVNEILAKWPEGRFTKTRIDELSPIQNAMASLGTATGLFLSKTLAIAMDRAREAGKTADIGAWKKKYTVSGSEEVEDSSGVVTLKDSHNMGKIRAVAEVYTKYSMMLKERGLFDYADMIIDVVHALRENAVLRNELEEQYQFILVDEFQDTNDAQMQLVRAISSNPMHEARPNVMVVGDDDQAIYKFQGAEISNIIDFRDKTYRDVSMIVLDQNYRSNQEILDYARAVVMQGSDRLENRFKDITKELTQGNNDVRKGDLSVAQYGTDIEEYGTVGKSIRLLLDAGEKAEEIAIIGRGHKELRALLPYLDQYEIPYEYVKKANVFDEEHIKELIVVCDYVSSVGGEGNRKDYLLPQLLSFPYFQIPRSEIFQVALSAKDKHLSFAAAVSESTSEGVQKAYAMISKLAAEAASTPLEHLLDHYMRESGFRDHYFGKPILKSRPGTYVHFLASLKTFIEGLRQWREGETLFVTDVGPFVDMHRERDIALISESPFTKAEHAVQIMTAHAAKGLEFGNVFIVAAHEKTWAGSGRANIAPIPAPLSDIAPAGDTEAEFIRLLYVAITRAKHSLHISGHKELVRFINDESGLIVKSSDAQVEVSAHENALAIVGAPYKEDEWAVLRRLVANYRMSVTHLNNFVDVINGGPLYFIEQNLLRFPQPMNVAGVYGSAIDKALTEFVLYPKFHAGEVPTLLHILGVFKKELTRARLPRYEFEKQERRGEEMLAAYYTARSGYFSIEDMVQVDMKDEGVVIDGAIVTGKIDFLRVSDGVYEVVDFKTGKSYSAWEKSGMEDHEKLKLHKYRQQLICYKLLLEGSIKYNRLPVGPLSLEFVEGVIDMGEIVTLPFSPTEEEVERFRKLISVVYKMISTLDFPDVSVYPENYEGVLAFEEDLIAGKFN